MTAPSAGDARGHLLLPDYCHAAAEAVISPPVYHRLFKFHLFPTVDVKFSRFSSGGTREPTSDRQKQPMQEFGCFFCFLFFFQTTKIPPRKNNLHPLIIRMRSSLMETDWPDKKNKNKKTNLSEISPDNICIVEPLGPSPLAHWPLSPPYPLFPLHTSLYMTMQHSLSCPKEEKKKHPLLLKSVSLKHNVL